MAKLFLQAASTSDQDMQNYKYLEQILTNHITMQYEIEITIQNMLTKKTQRSNGILNKILAIALDLLQLRFHQTLNACFELEFCLFYFKNSITIVLYKLVGERDYNLAKLYRPIAFLNTIGRTFESIMIHGRIFMTKTYQLLPPKHFGKRKDTLTENESHFLIERIMKAWNPNTTTFHLLLNIASVFDNVIH